MSRQTFARSVLGVAITVGVVACDRSDPPTAPTESSPDRSGRATPFALQAAPITLDEMYARVAEIAPGFAGFVRGEDGRPTLLLTDLDERTAVAAAFRSTFGDALALGADPAARQVRYRFLELLSGASSLPA